MTTILLLLVVLLSLLLLLLLVAINYVFSVCFCEIFLLSSAWQQWRESPLSQIWSIAAHFKASALSSMGIQDGNLTIDHHGSRQKIIVNGCLLWDGESFNHLVLNYPVARVVWLAIFFIVWNLLGSPKWYHDPFWVRGQDCLVVVPCCQYLNYMKERNMRCFDNNKMTSTVWFILVGELQLKAVHYFMFMSVHYIHWLASSPKGFLLLNTCLFVYMFK